jgi:hypothetical protein
MERRDVEHYVYFEWNKEKGRRKDEGRKGPLFFNSHYMAPFYRLRSRCPL